MFCGPHNNYCGTGAAPAYTSDTAMGMDTTGCNGQVIQTGSRTDYVDCPTTMMKQENYVVPRTVYGSRQETRTRTRTEMRQRVIPVTKYRNEMKMVPVQRQVAYQDYKTESYTVPKQENYNVVVPTQRIVNETRTRTRTIPGTKKCPVRVPVYTAKCNGAKAANLNDTGANLGTYDTGANIGTTFPDATGGIIGDSTALGTPLMNTPYALNTPAYATPQAAAPVTGLENMDFGNFTPYGKSS